MKKRRRKLAAPKRRDTPKLARHRKPAADDPNKKFALLARERDELLEQQAATSEVLKIVGSAGGAARPVSGSCFDTTVTRGVLTPCSASRRHSRSSGIADHSGRAHEPRSAALPTRESRFISST